MYRFSKSIEATTNRHFNSFQKIYPLARKEKAAKIIKMRNWGQKQTDALIGCIETLERAIRAGRLLIDLAEKIKRFLKQIFRQFSPSTIALEMEKQIGKQHFKNFCGLIKY